MRASFFLAAVVSLVSIATAAPGITVGRHDPCNLFNVGETVSFTATVDGEATEFQSALVDYFAKEVATQSFAVAGGKASIDLGQLPPGYYELTLKSGELNRKITFGVVTFVNRTAAEVRDGKYRFGIKKWGSGDPQSADGWSAEDAVAASCKLGLQWTRELFSQAGTMGVVDMTHRYPMNTVLKVERFPNELYDADRYGPMAVWEAKFGKGQWKLKTLPKKEPYLAWLRAEVSKIPPEQKVFEIWNEAWDKMSPEDFATLCNWIAPVIEEIRPGAIIGPNLYNDTSPFQFDARFIKAGGMKGMSMVALHPYAASEDRARMRTYRQWLREQLGRDIELYVTEFGSHSTPEGPAKRSEREQAQRVVRQSLGLFAEDITVFMPHWMGQSEQNPTYLEDWYGLFRLNRQPKPVIIAYANAARLIDGGRYVGDLWLGSCSDAMLFERGGVFTLALVTRGEEKHVEVNPGTAAVTLVDMVGNSKKLRTSDGKLSLAINGDVTYLVGVSPQLEKQASRELRADRWPAPAKPPRATRVVHRAKTTPVIDGNLTEWDGATQLALLNPKVNGDDASGIASVAWDANYFYVALNQRDNEMLNKQPRAKLYRQDCLELFLSTEPRTENGGFGPNDHQFFLTPTSGEGVPICGEIVDREAGKVIDVRGAHIAVQKTAKGWTIEAAIPWSQLGNFTPAEGTEVAMDMILNDADTSHERFSLIPVDSAIRSADPTTWALLGFEK